MSACLPEAAVQQRKGSCGCQPCVRPARSGGCVLVLRRASPEQCRHVVLEHMGVPPGGSTAQPY